jgi:hypothetical protein
MNLLPASRLSYFLILKMGAACSSEKSVDCKRATRRYVPDDRTPHNNRCENLKFYLFLPVCLNNVGHYNFIIYFLFVMSTETFISDTDTSMDPTCVIIRHNAMSSLQIREHTALECPPQGWTVRYFLTGCGSLSPSTFSNLTESSRKNQWPTSLLHNTDRIEN